MLTRQGIISATQGNRDMQTVMLAIYDQLDLNNQALGTNFLSPVNSQQKPASAPPPQASFTVSGANGAFNGQITNPPQAANKTLYHEVSFSSSSNFTTSITVLPVSTATSFNYANPGAAVFWRLRSSYDQQNWNSYTYFAGVVDSGLQSSSASAPNVPLNQTNYAFLDSVDNGTGSANVRVFGKAGLGFSYPAIKGSAETILPSATIINVPFNTSQVTAYNGDIYRVRPTLPQVFADGLTPTGAVSVVGAGAVTLPTIVPILSGGSVVGYNVTSQGNGLTGPLTLAVTGGGGAGATTGAQTIVGGKLISVAPGNAGSGYGGGTSVTISGGIFGGSTGGGQSTGGNNGRWVYSDPTTGGL